MESHIAEWLNLLIRWAHVTFGIAWIGASFYFNFLENSLNRSKDLKEGIAGNLWAIHGGGFYYLEKYKTAPTQLPEKLHWFKYEAYFTWLSGFFLLIIVYYLNAKVYLIDSNVNTISASSAIVMSLLSLLISWLVYDQLCKSIFAENNYIFSVVLVLFLTSMAYFLAHFLSGRAAFIHVGAILGTLMTGNVFFVIIPAQKAMVQAAKAGKIVDPALGKNALLRSRSNNYFTLPVVFIMISNHFPGIFASRYNWLFLLLLSLLSVLVKHGLNLLEKGQKALWIIPATLCALFALVFVTKPEQKILAAKNKDSSFVQVHQIIRSRCLQCHSNNPSDDIFKVPPNGISFDEPQSIMKYADRIMARVVLTKTMPLANKTAMTDEERDLIRAWIDSGQKSDP